MTESDCAPWAGMSVPVCFADHALQVIRGEETARAYLQRLRDGMALPGELGVMLSYLQGEALHGALRMIEKALEDPRHA